ncbi:MAG: TIGR00341 family protein [Saprospiraceae bacterium]|nr:TIGR00341 family protein [Saprospiraceae bacterium]
MANEERQNAPDRLWSAVQHFLHDLFDIKTGLDWVGTVTSIRNKVALKGENVWMLIAATMIASVGLNTNSGAVIIGAMLISPLMSPILAIGLGIGINDRELLWKAVKNFSVATIAAIVTSVLYFKFLTPFKEAGSEIISRTQPTILDAIVAIFGGTAGIVAVSRKEKGAAIPGVAIATALLPPLAVAGYGLANRNFEYFSKAFYLFFLNSMLIALATYLIVRFLKFPFKSHPSPEEKRRATFGIGVFVIALLVPGVLILNQLRNERDTALEVNKFFKNRFDEGENQMYGTAVLDNDPRDSVAIYKVSYRGVGLNDSLLNLYNENLSRIVGKPALIDPTLLNLTKEQLDRLERRTSTMSKQLQEQTDKELAYQQEISNLRNTIDSLSYEARIFQKLEKDAVALWPEIESLQFADSFARNFSDSLAKQQPVLLVKWDRRLSRRDRQRKEEQLKRYLEAQEGLQRCELVSLN